MALDPQAQNAAYRAAHPETNWAEINRHMGTAWKHEPSYPKKKQTLFPTPWNQRGRNSRVPKTTLNATRGFKSNGFVRPQDKRNSTLNTRRRVFEDNFIKRIIKMVEDSMLKDIPIDLQKYADRLVAPDCSREEAIVLYDELIAVFIIFMLYIVYVIKDTMEKLQVNPSLNPSKMMISFDKAEILSKITQVLIRSTTVAVTIPVLLLPALLLTAIGSIGVSLVIFVSLTLILFVTAVKTSDVITGHNVILKREKDNLLYVIQKLLNTIRDNRNTIKISSVKDEIKYWGLTKAQVDYLLIPDNNYPHATLRDTTEYPIPSAEELGINENDHQELENARQASIELKRRMKNEEYEKLGYFAVDVEVIKEFILKAGENKEILAPNDLFSNSIVKFGKRNDPNRKIQEYNYDRIMNQQYAREHATSGAATAPSIIGGKAINKKRKTHKRRK